MNYKRTKLACYTAYFTMSTIFSLPPLLFVTFHEMYHISYTLLGTLVLTNFFTQLTVDLIFTFFTKYFNVHKIVKVMPLITSAGLFIYALTPNFFPEHAYVGLLLGTVIFSISAGLSEVLLSPVIAAIPSDNPQKDMSMLHSLYAFGTFTVIIVSTAFLKLFGSENWMYLTLFLGCWPILASVLFMRSSMPDMSSDSEKTENINGSKHRAIGIALCAACIFLGSCSENTMFNWVSSYMENALHIDKALGDLLGMAMFAILLGFARIAYAKYGKNIMRILFLGMAGATMCYLIAGLSTNPVAALIACFATGLCTSMLWPGTLITMEENVPRVGVAIYALMAASGDFGASIAPQLMGIVIDHISASNLAAELSTTLSLTTEQIGMKAGMLVTAIFPILGTLLVLFIMRYFKKTNTNTTFQA